MEQTKMKIKIIIDFIEEHWEAFYYRCKDYNIDPDELLKELKHLLRL